MPRPITVNMASRLSAEYDVFFVDQFGVLRDDIGPYQGAVDALRQLSHAGKRIVILSNSGRSGEYNAERLVKLGFAPESFDFFVTSGDVAFEILSRPGVAIYQGSRALTISSGGDTNLADRLGLTSIRSGKEADIVIISGSEAERISMHDYREMLRPAAENNVPCYCTNPDIRKLHEGSVAPGAGSIAMLYEAMGGKVVWIGKPYPEIYDHALRLAGVEDRRRVVCIGDSVEHDILGAASARLDSVLVRTGILADMSDGELDRIITDTGASPTYVMQAFVF
ncbi:HAD superfamily hydrolase (TIGR01459 family) [Rhizobium tibeticum]|uniref:TIGR01459 family HAD-type hydrolase n=1 Tax=Rhizobium tibeticum TaxID=501024 RepID=UPI002780F57B|nr:TIGR01459 family HAD-type hydrolase [Rhizobium tibeticum]MDP9812886.1 HAD superfamily hydrolase (TIGR01459 family) [Rhizobium tibeticum]